MAPSKAALLVLALGIAAVPAARAQCTPAEQAKLSAPNAAPGDQAGGAVAIFGDTAVVGAAGASGSGPGWARVYLRDHPAPDQWGQVAVLRGSPAAAGDLFGTAVAIWEDTILVGAPGYVGLGHGSRAYVFERDSGGPDSWGLTATLEGNAIPLWSGFDQYGLALAIRGDWALIGAIYDSQNGVLAGAVHMHQRDAGGAGQWGRVKKFKGKKGDELGSRVALGEHSAVAGDSAASHEFYRLVGANWVLDGKAPKGASGSSVAIFGETALIGSPSSSVPSQSTKNEGIVHVVKRKTGVWKKTRQLSAAFPETSGAFGTSLALTEDVALIGAPGSYLGAGSVLVFDRNASWVQSAEIRPADGSIGDRFGSAVAASSNLAIAGAPFDDTGAGLDAGSAYVHLPIQTSPVWFCLSGQSSSGCQPTVTANGAPSASAASGFTITATGVEGQQSGLMYYGTRGPQVKSWGNGTSFQCVAPPLRRTGLQSSGGTLGACDGTLSIDFNAWMWSHPGTPRAGDTVTLQAWYQDPLNTSSQYTALSEGLRFAVCP